MEAEHAVYILRLELEVASEPTMVLAEGAVNSVAEAVERMSSFILEFGEPDAGPQSIRITLTSRLVP